MRRMWDSSGFGQYDVTETKYRAAVAACSDIMYLEMTVTHIAREFGLSPAGLSNQLRIHFPDVMPLREDFRRALGFANNIPKGRRPQSARKYEEAVNLLRKTNLSIVEVAARCGVGSSALRSHVLAYHKDIADKRRFERETVDCKKLHRGEMNPYGKKNEPTPSAVARFASALELYRTTSMSNPAICRQCGVSVSGFQQYLYRWHMVDVLRRRGYDLPPDMDQADIPENLPPLKRFNPSARERYAPVIAQLREGASVRDALEKTIGVKYADVFRAYMRVHEPELYEEAKRRGKYPHRNKV